MEGPAEQIQHALEHAVAECADAWLNDPRDYEAYRRLVGAVLTRRAHLQPTLDIDAQDTGEQIELDDVLADEHPAHPISDGIDPSDPAATLRRLQGR